MAAMASLVQDVWLGWEPRLRARRLAPWEEAPVRLVFHLDAGSTLDDPPVAEFLETAAERLEVVAVEPRGEGGSSGRLGAEVLDDARRLAHEAPGRFGPLPLVVGGYGLGGWVALALEGTKGVAGTLALAPSLGAGARSPERSALHAALVAALATPSPGVPALVVEGRQRHAEQASAVSEWLAPRARAARISIPGEDAACLAPPWPGVVVAWVEAVGHAARG
jgi:alpha-beta hydrolase superfamily lysophospholipase